MKTVRTFGALLFVFVLMLSACAAPAAPSAAPAADDSTAASADSSALPESIKIGAVIPLTGRFGAGGAQIQRGYELAVEAINADGGVDVQGTKIPLEMIVVDDESDPAKTVQRLEDLNSNDQVLVYLGGFGSPLHAAAAGIAEKNKIPYLGVAFAFQGVHANGFKYLFSPFPKSPELAKATLDLFDSLDPKPTNLFGFIEKTDWGAEMNAEWQAQAEERGYSYTLEEYAPGDQDFSAMILRAKEAGADAVLSLPTPPDGLAIAKQMKELDFNPAASVVIRAADGPNWPENLGKDGDYVLLMTGWSNDISLPGVAEMNEAHVAKYESPATPITGPAYNVLLVLADAIGRAATLDRDGIRDALAATDMSESLIGPVKFREDGSAEVLTVVSQYQDGKTVSVWPPDVAAAQIVYPAPAYSER
ncbi:MAG: amino acid ABC transporter substrate-binding protein [Caldilineaceae bacterium]|nr:amino acid ABC transporter substrate-binding protein [Caldilineaceae bacterium]MCB0088812.1 amino acid ABC transporter substrate-binding protein [Caldilineaceae bacterium]MCB0094269.1 amino acid ABC transporter substrate-binding protein [Caldilineaceae bacterium]